ncbi:MAG TPA: type III PLP-dependent enzyme [Gammaproteobacteria bacterium]
MRRFNSAPDYLTRESPADPVICHRPHAAAAAARWFTSHFPGSVLYAVKANPSPVILDALYGAGIRRFDVTSLAEAELASRYADARLYYMNPVKHPAHIRTAYHEHGVREFALDTRDELEKILEATGHARDLGLHVRLAVDNARSRLPLEDKFGVATEDSAELLVATRVAAERLGVCFHVGSQAMDPRSYARAIERANHAIGKAGVILDTLDVGGGFPAAYPDLATPPLEEYLRIITDAWEESLTSETCELLCEPGRALVAESASLLVNVVLRKGRTLYINDGAYGSLFDAAHCGFDYPVRALRSGRERAGEERLQFSLYGPTCDSIDHMPGPFLLPADTRAGDYIEIGQLGAYGQTMRSSFNGFDRIVEVIVADEPLLSLFSGQELPAVDARPLA